MKLGTAWLLLGSFKVNVMSSTQGQEEEEQGMGKAHQILISLNLE